MPTEPGGRPCAGDGEASPASPKFPQPRYDQSMADDLLGVLTRFQREVVLPDLEHVVDGTVSPLRGEALANFDAIVQRLGRAESENAALSAAVGRVEQRLGNVDQKIDRLALRSELLALRDRIQAPEQKIAEIEAQL